ncbi:MAG TPA: NAD(P)/FAD-dependent oxidoreductase [Candidatus Thermoplasmatota archaeon]|nr:NAD(P)/FAD-dependent oxidoreductase [Candidatus Thermoplasmatota archaeon]
MDVVVVGGGAAGFFGALRAAGLGARATLLEAGAEPLAKVAISGGGRCNVTHALHDAAAFVAHYPRGAKELRSVLARFAAKDTMAWFEARGVALKVEADRRVFPVSDDSASIVDALLAEARALDVDVRARARPEAVERDGARFRIALKGGGTIGADRVLLATGSSPAGHALAAKLGHTIVPPVPALFSFVVRDPRLDGLAGLAVPRVRATLACDGLKKPVTKEGPLLVTHQGLSAHAVLRLSAAAARELAATRYAAEVAVDFAPDATDDALRLAADAARAANPRGTIGAHAFVDTVPRRLWDRLVAAAGIDPATRWSEVPKKGLHDLVGQLKRARFVVSGRGDFREEIVTAGGVARREVDWTRMESRLVPGLHFAGEILDVDGLTGGFNLQNAWSTGWVAGSAMADPVTRGP